MNWCSVHKSRNIPDYYFKDTKERSKHSNDISFDDGLWLKKEKVRRVFAATNDILDDE